MSPENTDTWAAEIILTIAEAGFTVVVGNIEGNQIEYRMVRNILHKLLFQIFLIY